MPYIYLIVSVFMSASTTVFGKLFNKKAPMATDSSAFYNFLQLASAFLAWGILFSLDFSFEVSVLWYSLLFGLCYTICMVGVIYALKYGPAVLTTLFISLSLIVTVIWGFVFWDVALNILVVIGLVLVVAAIFLCLNTDNKEKKSFSWKWLFFALMASLGNAGCAIVQRTQQVRFNGMHGNMMMFFAVGISFLTCLILYLRSNKKDSVILIKRTGWIPVVAGLCNVMLNLFIMLLATTTLSPSLIYPVIGVGALMVVTLISLFYFKEKMTKMQWLGIAFGSIAVALLSI